MWRNYLTVGVRSLAKNRTYSVINIAGLAIGMAACLMILLFVRYETSYDQWIPGVEDSYQLQTWIPKPVDGNGPYFLQMASYITADRIKKDFPQVERVVYALSGTPIVVKNGQVAPATDYVAVSDDFLAVVNLPLVRGSRTALATTDTAVLTQREALRQFGTEDAVGRTLTLIQKGEKHDYRVTGVLRDLPKNSSFKIAALVRRDFASFFAKEQQFLTCWGCQSGWVYVRLKSGSDPAAIEAGLPAFEKRNIPDTTNGGLRTNPGDDQDWHVVNLADVHLGKAQDGSMTLGNDQQSITTFAIIAFLILGMAVVNFTNLATARASQRAREVALRKVLGANRRQLVVQFLGESVLMAAVAMLLALALAELLVPVFAAFLDADIALHYLGRDGVLLPALGLALLVGVLGGLYPAFFLSRFQPAAVLKANKSASDTPGSGRLRSALVVAQFAVSIGLIICTAVIFGQTVYARSVDPGYKRDHILQVDGLTRYQLIGKGEALAQQMRRVPGVVAVGRTDIGVATNSNNNVGILVPGGSRQVLLGTYRVDAGAFDALGLKLVAGRWFNETRPADDSSLPFPDNPEAEKALAARGVNVVMNELAIKQLGFKSAQEAIGKTVQGTLFSDEAGVVPITIVGVVANSRFRSIRTPIDPLFFRMTRESPTTMIVRYRGDAVAVRAGAERVWKNFVSDVPFVAQFSDEIIRGLYQAEDKRARIFAAFALLAVVIGCLGLFGLAAFTAERRTKEIGIRKVLGARTRDVVRLLVWQFSRPVVLANIIAWPIAWWMMRDWLNGFDDRIALNPVPFLVAGAIALLIAVGTVAGHAFRIARANPIHALRYE